MRSILKAIDHHFARRRAMRAVSALDARQLEDIGLAGRDLREAIRQRVGGSASQAAFVGAAAYSLCWPAGSSSR